MITSAELIELFDRVVVINLESRPDRWERFERHIAELDWPFQRYERFRAVDGSRLKTPQWWRQGGGAWGCLQSHLRVIERAMMEGNRSILVLEDDACFPPNLRVLAEQFVNDLPGDWDQIYLGGQHLRRKINSPVEITPNVYRAFNINRTHAYGMKDKFLIDAYRWLTDYVRHSRNPKHHLDHRFGVLHETKQHKIYVPREWIAGQCEGFSNIKEKAVPVRWWSPNPVPAEKLPPFVAVVGLHRSGSSCLAGVLHKLGVHMGDRLIGYEKTGGFEGVGLARVCEAAYPFPSTKLRIQTETLRGRLAEHIRYVQESAFRRGLPMAGGKYPHLCAMGDLLKDICANSLRVIHINRPLDVSIRSLQERSNKCTGHLRVTDEAAERVQRWLWVEKERFLASVDHLTIEYEDLLADPRREIRRITQHLNIAPGDAELDAAVSHVDPTQRHYRNQECNVSGGSV